MEIDIYEINAFTNKQFGGNPAAVCPLSEFLSPDVMLAMAAQNNLPETAFLVPENDQYHIRWFAPKGEVALCGHATLASAYVLFNFLRPELKTVQFNSASGLLSCHRENNFIVLDFPARPHEEVTPPKALLRAMTIQPKAVLGSDDYIVVLENQTQIENLEVDMDELGKLDRRGVVFTAQGDGDDVDFVSRVFHPKLGIGEDPVCGSAHCELAPFWGSFFNKSVLLAEQLSARHGDVICELSGDRVLLKGECSHYLTGSVKI